NNPGNTSIQVNVGTMNIGATVTIKFRVKINNPLQAGVVFVENQGTVSSNELSDVATDDPDVGGSNDRTRTVVIADPVLNVTKTDFLFVDANGDGNASPGDKLLYRLRVTNSGNIAAASLTFTDTPDANSTLVVGTVQTTRGTITTGNQSGDKLVKVNIGNLGVGQRADISFQVTINANISVAQIANQATISHVKAGSPINVLSDDPDTATPTDATVTQINQPVSPADQ